MESSVSGGSTTQTTIWPTVLVVKELHTLIGTVREIGKVTTMDEVLEGMKMYIVDKQLYDPENPYRVCCKDDQLGVVLGVEEFTIPQVKTLLKKVVIPVQNRNCSPDASCSLQSDNLSKRKLDENADSEQRKLFVAEVSQHASPMKLYIPPTPESCCNESDTADSLQGYETALVKDTSDTSLTSDGAFQYEEDIYDIEYEVESVSSDFHPSDTSCSASDVISESEVMLNAAIFTFISKTDSDQEFFADDSSDDEDEEISEFDHWECNRCHSQNRPPMRYCEKCWEQRLEWLPDKSNERPFPPRRRKMKKAGQLMKNSTSASQASVSQCDQDSQSQSSPGSSQSSAMSSSQPLTNTPDPSDVKMCLICVTKPANASIIHAKYAHQVTCYRCARKLQKQRKRCPICRRAIERVVYQISS